MSIPTLTTDRLTLRPYARADFETYANHASTDWARYMGGPIDRSKAWSWFTNDTASWALYGFGTLAIEVDGALAGFAGLVHPPSFPEPECGWAIYPAFQGRGYAKEAGAAMLPHSFATSDLMTIVSYVDPDNHASQSVAKAVGGTVDPDAKTPFGDTNVVFRHQKAAA